MDENNNLKIQDINSVATLSIMATLDGKKMELPAEFVGISEEEYSKLQSIYGPHILVVADVVKAWEEKVFKVSFQGHLSKLELVAVIEDGVFHWDNVKIYKTKLDSGQSVQILRAMCSEGSKYNRRRGVRIDLDKRMELTHDSGKDFVLVRDLSYCGVGFVQPDGKEFPVGKKFLLHLSDVNAEGEPVILGKLVGKVVNRREQENGKVICGCIISSDHAAFLQRYIAKKQIEEISGKKEFVGYQRMVEGDNWKEKTAKAIEASLYGEDD